MVPTGSYDALLVVSFGGPEGPDEVMPFLENVTSGRGIPRERLEAVAEHYYHFGGVSPINQQCRDLIAAIESDFAAHGLDLPVYWGNRNWHPFLADTLARMADDGVGRALAFVTGAYSSYSSCRQYREDIAAAREQVGPRAPEIAKLRHYFNHPGFVEPMADNTRLALERLTPRDRDGAHLVFTAHSIPTAMADTSGPGGPEAGGGDYVRQLHEASRLVAERAAGSGHPWELVYQSRSGPPSQPWLEPDVCDHLEGLDAKGVTTAVLVPIGFVSDHLEVAYDLDTEAVDTAARLGMTLTRAATVGDDPRFAAMVRELVRERLRPDVPRAALGDLGPSHDACPLDCCPNPRGPRPTVASAES